MKASTIFSAIALTTLAGTATNTLAGPTTINWLSPVDGNWNVGANWDGGVFPNGSGVSAVLGLSGMYTVAITSNITIDGLGITNPSAVLTTGSNLLTVGSSGIMNDGTIVMNVGGSSINANLSFSAPATISGSGEIMLNAATANDDAQINTTGALTNGAGHTIRGSGRLNGTITNNGSIIADDAGNIGIRFAGTLDSSGGGTILADGSSIRLDNSLTTNGTFETANGGVVVADSGTALLDTMTNEGTMHVLTSGMLDVQNSFINNGTVVINPDMLVFNARMRVNSDLTIEGTGDIQLMAVSATDDAQLLPNGPFTLTIGSGQTVHGSGWIGSSTDGSVTNNGIIRADDPAQQLLMRGIHNAGSGTYEADNAVLGIAANAVMNSSVFQSSGTGAVTLDTSVATLNSCTNQGVLNIKGGSDTLAINGSITNNGTININSTGEVFNATMRFDSPTTISGVGQIVLDQAGDFNDAHMTTSGGDVIIGSAQDVRGSGRINGSGGMFDNRGIIRADDPAFPLVLTGVHDGSLGGDYRADNGMLSLRPGSTLTGGTFWSTGTGIVEMNGGGTATIGSVVNNGAMGIAGEGNFLALNGPLENNGSIIVNTTAQIFNARIRADVTTEISGTGTIELVAVSAPGDAEIFTESLVTLTIGDNQVVSGSGLIQPAVDGMIINNGTFIANDPVVPLHLDNTIDSTNGEMIADGAVMLLRGGAVITGGTYDTLNDGVVRTDSGTITVSDLVSNGTFEIQGVTSTLNVSGTMVNNGVLSMNPQMSPFDARLIAQSDVTISGTGSIQMDVGSVLPDADINANGFTITLGENQVIHGSGRVRGVVDSQGGLAPGGVLRQIDVGVFSLGANAQSTFDLGGINASEFDRVTLGDGDTLTLGGAVTINLDDGYVPFFGDSWDIISASGGGVIMDEFDLDSTVVPVAPLGLVYRVVYEDQRVFVVLTCDSDLTGDGVLDFFDVSLFLNFYAAGDERADFTGDGQFDFFDLSLFLNLFSGKCGG